MFKKIICLLFISPFLSPNADAMDYIQRFSKSLKRYAPTKVHANQTKQVTISRANQRTSRKIVIPGLVGCFTSTLIIKNRFHQTAIVNHYPAYEEEKHCHALATEFQEVIKENQNNNCFNKITLILSPPGHLFFTSVNTAELVLADQVLKKVYEDTAQKIINLVKQLCKADLEIIMLPYGNIPVIGRGQPTAKIKLYLDGESSCYIVSNIGVYHKITL